MTTYVTIPNGDIDQDSPVTQPLLTALRDNVLAIQEGDATAPNLLLGVAAKTVAGGIGTYCFARGSVDVAFGSTTAGSNLTPTSAFNQIQAGSFGTGALNAGAALSGTWRCMGTGDATVAGSSGGTAQGSTLWMRIS